MRLTCDAQRHPRDRAPREAVQTKTDNERGDCWSPEGPSSAGSASGGSLRYRVNEDKATSYHRLKRQASVVSVVMSVALLGGLIVTGWSAALRNVADAWAPAAWHAPAHRLPLRAPARVVNEAVGLPLAFYSGFVLERRFGLSNESVAGWFAIRRSRSRIGLLLGGAAAELSIS